MRRLVFIVCLAGLYIGLCAQHVPNFFEINQQKQKQLSILIQERNYRSHNLHEHEDGALTKYNRWYYTWRYRVGQQGEMNTGSKKAAEYFQKTPPNCSSNADDQINWQNLGPLNSDGALSGAKNCYSSGGVAGKQNQGRIESINADPTNPNIVLSGGYNGGVWKSINGGQTWYNTTDDEGFSVFGITAIIRHPDDKNTIYASTSVGGGLWESGRAVYGMGVIVSFDGGESWQTTGLNFSSFGVWTSQISQIAIDPNSTLNNTIIYATSPRRVYRWQGNHQASSQWQEIFYNNSYQSGPLWYGSIANNDVVVDFYGTCWFTNRDGLYKYKNGVVSLVDNYTVPLPYQDYDSNCMHGQSHVRHDFNIERNNQNHIVFVVSMTRQEGSTCAATRRTYLYKSIDGGQNWSEPKEITASAYYNASAKAPQFAVSANNSDRIYIERNGRCVHVSEDFGNTFIEMDNSQNHVDVRCIYAYSGSGNDDVVFLGTDGGISKTIDGLNWIDISGQNMSIANFYGLGISQTDDQLIMAGAQDGSINMYRNGEWFETRPGGDNGECLINPFNNNMIYQQSQNYVMRTTLNDNNTVSYSSINGDVHYVGGWMNPMHWNPSVENEFFIGVKNLFVGNSDNSSLTIIEDTSIHPARNISSVAVSENNKDIVYYTTDGYVWGSSASNYDGVFKATRDAAGDWSIEDITANLRVQVHGKIGLKEPITDIEVDQYDENRIWITRGSFSSGSKVYYSDNGGLSWQNMTKTGLPNFPITAICYQALSNDRLYVGGDGGVFFYDKPQDCWIRYGNNGPQCMVNDMEINQCAQKLVLATHGRGVWQADLINDYDPIKLSDQLIIWNKDMTVASDIIVQAGSTLRISNAVINMAKNTSIILEPSARLEVFNSTLTNMCGYTWKGIQVQGNQNAPQDQAFQAKLVLNNSTIEFADEAISTSKPGTQVNNGGIIEAKRTKFLNNKRSVEFVSYGLEPSKSYFELCDFIVDSNYRHLNSLLYHVSLWDISGVKFKGCSFEIKDQSWNYSLRNIAINAYDATFSVDHLCQHGINGCIFKKSTFKGFNNAVVAFNTGTTHTFSVLNSEFSNNVYAVVSTANNFCNIRNNTIQVGKPNTVDAPQEHEGIVVFNSYGFNIDHNKISPNIFTEYPVTIGIRVNDSRYLNEVYHNEFEKQLNNENRFYANMANGYNRDFFFTGKGLKYHCNVNKNNLNNGRDFSISGQGISSQLGSPNLPAGNIFSWADSNSNTLSGSDFFNSSLSNITYYYTNFSRQEPKNYVQLSPIQIASNRYCPVRYYPVDIAIGGSSALKITPFIDQSIFEDLNQKTTQLRELKKLNKTDEIMKIEHELFDLDKQFAALLFLNKNSLDNWLDWSKSKQLPIASITPVLVLIQKQEYLKAKQFIERLRFDQVAEIMQKQDFERLKKIFLIRISELEQGNTIFEFSQQSIQELSEISEYSGISQYYANSLLNANGIMAFKKPVYSDFNKESSLDLVSQRKFKVFPNPTSDIINIESLEQIDNSYSVRLIGVDGRLIQQKTMSNKNDLISFDCSSLKSGSYLLQIEQQGKIIDSQNFILSK